MSFTFHRTYRGPLRAAIFDWAGTTVDFGCLAPAGAFVNVLARHGVMATDAQARSPMGMHKRDHIRAMLQLPELREQWTARHDTPPTEADVETLFQEFIPLQLEVLPQYCNVIPGVVEVVDSLRAQGMGIGATTGYNAEMMQLCMEAALRAGYRPDVSVAVTEVPAGRPAPWMALKAAMHLNVYPPEALVKVGDTPVDVAEGLNAGMWTVAVVESGNEMGLSEADLAALRPATRELCRRRAHEKLAQAGAHYVIDRIGQLPGIVAEINARLAQGEKP